MVGMMIPIQMEGGVASLHSSNIDAKCNGNNRSRNTTSEAALRKPLCKKNSRQKLRTVNIEIQLEGESGQSKASRASKTQVSGDLIRKNGISAKAGNSMCVSVPKHKLQPRRSSSKDLLRGAVTRRQSGKDLRSILKSRQSSKDIVNGNNGPGHSNLSKDPRVCLIKRESGSDVFNDRFTIRRDSINGLRIVSKEATDTTGDDDNDTIARLGDISLTGHKQPYSKFQLEALRCHNMYRAKHGACNLTLDQNLCGEAAKYAQYLADTDTFEHSGDPDNGENLYWSWSSDPRWVVEGAEPVTSWYDECRGYDYTREPVSSETGHFTQLVWSNTTQLGVGVTKSDKTGKFYVVMKYFPPCNYNGQYRQHLSPPQ